MECACANNRERQRVNRSEFARLVDKYFRHTAYVQPRDNKQR